MTTHGAKYAGKDFYKLLHVKHTASAQEIKLAYYKIAQKLHPDKHSGCASKEAQFKRVNEAYDVLRDAGKRREYDFTVGHRYNRNRRTAPPPNYGKVYTSRPPPDWDTVWDHAKHYEMHYGDGFQKMAVEQMRKSLEREGGGHRLDYQSPLGRGFHFSSEPLHHGVGQHNPFSKRTPQGPPKVTYEYTEGTIHSNNPGRETVSRRERIVEELHTRRRERHQRRNHHHGNRNNNRGRSESPSQQRRSSASPFAQYSTHATASRHHHPFGGGSSTRPESSQQPEQAGGGCVIS